MGKRITDPKRIRCLTDPIIKGLKPASGIVRDRRQCLPGPFHPRAAFRLQRIHAARPPAGQEIHAAGDRPLRREAACRRSRDGARLDREDQPGALIRRTASQLQRIESIKLRSKTFRAAFDAYWRTHIEGHRTSAKVRQIFDEILLPVLGDRPIVEMVAGDSPR